ncbi:MAG: amidohydrolase [Pseudomonadota bacterium]
MSISQLGTGWLLAIAVLLVGGCADSTESTAAQTSLADLVLKNGNVITLEGDTPLQAVAVRGDTIVGLGADAEIEAFVGPQTQVIDLDGRTAIPGFIEGHGHFLSFGRAQQILDLTTANSWDDIVGQVAAAADAAAPGEWIFGRGWHQEKWQQLPAELVDGVPVNDALNRVAPEHPVVLGHASGHAAMVNAAALRAAGIDNNTVDPPGGTIVRKTDGTPTGLLRENAEDPVNQAAAAYQASFSAAERERVAREQVTLAGRAVLRHGITSFHDAGTSFADIDFLHQVANEDGLPVRLYVMIGGESLAAMQARVASPGPLVEHPFLTVRSIKQQIDGALGSHGAWLLAPYSDLPTTEGLVLQDIETLTAIAEFARDFDLQLNVHAIGTRANRETLDLYERVWQDAEVFGADLRWRIEHAQHVHPLDVPRFAEMGVFAAVQGVHCTSDGPWIPTRLGAPRTQLTSYRWRDLLDTGARVGNGTDAPVEAIDPIASFHASVVRRMGTGALFYPQQAMTRMEALRSYTIENAYGAFAEDRVGSLKVGKLADIAVLSQDLLTVPDEEILNTRVEMTILNGQVVFRI